MMVFDQRHFLPRTVLSRGTGSTGDAVDVSAKAVPFFKTGKELRERLNDK